MSKLTDDLKTVLGTYYGFYYKAQAFHWNTTGPRFSQLHELFGDIYSSAYDAIDPFAEFIRALGEFAPVSLERIMELNTITSQQKIPKEDLMIKELIADSDTMISLLQDLFDTATEAREQGIANFMADRISAHEKQRWMLRSTLSL
jgi:starvation-inducible DNA-binding protein